MYSVAAYGRMLDDHVRTQSYVRALEQVVTQDSVVLDIGTGPGFFALLAAKLGARKVYAVEPDDVIQIAMTSARLNGLSDRITFFQDVTTNVSLPEPADIIVTDLRGVLPIFSNSLITMQDARTRLLKPGGSLIPARDLLWAALVQDPTTYRKLTDPWELNEEIELSPARDVVLNTWSKFRANSSGLLCEPVNWQVIDYYNISSADVCADIALQVQQSGTAHGVAIWFDSELNNEISFSNAPGCTELIYGNGFFPFLKPVELAVGETVNLHIRADFIKDDYVWIWETRVENREDPSRPKAHFKQTTLSGYPLSLTKLKKRSASYVPVPSEEALIQAYAVSQMDGASTLEVIATKVAERFPDQLDQSKALDLVAELSIKFSR